MKKATIIAGGVFAISLISSCVAIATPIEDFEYSCPNIEISSGGGWRNKSGVEYVDSGEDHPGQSGRREIDVLIRVGFHSYQDYRKCIDESALRFLITPGSSTSRPFIYTTIPYELGSHGRMIGGYETVQCKRAQSRKSLGHNIQFNLVDFVPSSVYIKNQMELANRQNSMFRFNIECRFVSNKHVKLGEGYVDKDFIDHMVDAIETENKAPGY